MNSNNGKYMYLRDMYIQDENLKIHMIYTQEYFIQMKRKKFVKIKSNFVLLLFLFNILFLYILNNIFQYNIFS